MALLDVAAAAAGLLAIVEAAAADHDIALPSRRYLADGLAGVEAWDCEQVTVGLVQLTEGLAAGLAGGVARPQGVARSGAGMLRLPAAHLRVEIVRATPTMSDGGLLPTMARASAAGIAALTDAALLHEVRARWASTTNPDDPTDVYLGPITPSGPQGGYAAMGLVVGVTLTETVP